MADQGQWVDVAPEETQWVDVPNGAAAPSTPSDFDQFAKQYVAEARSPISTSFKQVGGLAKGLAELVAGVPQGAARILGEASVAPKDTPQTLAEGIAQGINAVNPAAGLLLRAAPNTTQTALEVVPRATYELGDALRQAVNFTSQEPLLALKNVTNPFLGGIPNMIPRNPSEEEILKAFERQLSNQAFAEVGEKPIAPEILGKADIPLARGALAVAPLVGEAPALVKGAASGLKSAASALAAPIERAIARVKPTAVQSAMSVLGVTEAEAESMLPSAVSNLSKAAGKATPTASEVIEAAPKARQALFEETTDGLSNSKKAGLVAKGATAYDDIAEAIQSDARFVLDEPDTVNRLLKQYEKYKRDLDPLEARKLLEDTNKKLISYWDKTARGQAVDLTDAEVRAERAFAANLSEQVDDLYKIGSGKDASPYRDIGKIIEFEKNLKLEQEAGAQAFAKRVAPTRVKGGGSPVTKGEAIRKTGRNLTTAFRKSEPELLDSRLREIFKGTSKPEAPPLLTDDFITSLSQGYLPSIPP